MPVSFGVCVDTPTVPAFFRATRRLADCDGTSCSIPVNASRAWAPDPEPAVSEPVGVRHVAVVTADLAGFRAFSEETIGLEARGCRPTPTRKGASHDLGIDLAAVSYTHLTLPTKA